MRAELKDKRRAELNLIDYLSAEFPGKNIVHIIYNPDIEGTTYTTTKTYEEFHEAQIEAQKYNNHQSPAKLIYVIDKNKEAYFVIENPQENTNRG